MGAGGFHVRVRDGIGCGSSAMATRLSEPHALWGAWVGFWRCLVCAALWLCCCACSPCRAVRRGWLLCMVAQRLGVALGGVSLSGD